MCRSQIPSHIRSALDFYSWGESQQTFVLTSDLVLVLFASCWVLHNAVWLLKSEMLAYKNASYGLFNSFKNWVFKCLSHLRFPSCLTTTYLTDFMSSVFALIFLYALSYSHTFVQRLFVASFTESSRLSPLWLFVSLQISRETFSLNILYSSDIMFAYALVNIVTITVLCTCLVSTLRDILGLFVWKTKLNFYWLLYLTCCLPFAVFHAVLTLSSHSQPQNTH